MNRKVKKRSETVRCELIEWESIENEEEILSALKRLRSTCEAARRALTTITTLDPSITYPLTELDKRVRIDPGHPLHTAVEDLLRCLPESEWHIDEAGNRMFRNDGGLWAALCDISRLPVTDQTDYVRKRLSMSEVRSQFQHWIECQLLTDFGAGDGDSLLSRIRRRFIRSAMPPQVPGEPLPEPLKALVEAGASSLAEFKQWSTEAEPVARACDEAGVRLLVKRVKVHARWLSRELLDVAIKLGERDRLGLIRLLELAGKTAENGNVPRDISKKEIPAEPPKDPEDQLFMARLVAERAKPDTDRKSDADVIRELAPNDKGKQVSIKKMWTRYKPFYLTEYR
jgi:hypothetical protein